MSILSLDDYIASSKQKIPYYKTATATVVGNAGYWTVRNLAGNPGAMTLPVGNVTTGVVPTDTTTGAPFINTFDVGAVGYLGAIQFGSNVSGRIRLDDIVWYAGAISSAALATTTFTGNPSFSSRMPGGSFVGTQIWIEVTTTMTTTVPIITVTYTNSAGTAGRSTGTFTLESLIARLTIGRWVQLPLQAGDVGVQSIQSVQVSTISGAGAFNIMVIRPLWNGYVPDARSRFYTMGFEQTGMPQVFQDSCIVASLYMAGTSTGTPTIDFEIASN